MELALKKAVVYTAITKGYDTLIDPRVVSPDCDYVCFTDDPNIESTVWQVNRIGFLNLDAARRSRVAKILPHWFFDEYEFSVWVDGNFSILEDPMPLCKKYLGDAAIALFAHPEERTIWEEFSACTKLRKDDAAVLKRQEDAYKASGYVGGRIHAGGVILRNHTTPWDSVLVQAMEAWWKHLYRHSSRDQISLEWCLWQYSPPVATIPGNIRDNETFRLRRHL